MPDRRLWVLAVLSLGCAHRVASNLPAAPVPTPVISIAGPADVLPALLHGDPLARSQPDLDPARIRPFAPRIAAWVADVHAWSPDEVPARLQAEEPQWRGTPLLALSRGRRLAGAERLMEVPTEPGPDVGRQVLVRLSALRSTSELPGDLDRNPFAVFGSGDWREQTLDTADAWVLAAWLDGPHIDLGPVAATLESPVYDRLRSQPLGALIRARSAGAAAADSNGWPALVRATGLALERAAADTDAEQEAWRTHRQSVATETGAAHPVTALLERARDGLTKGAADDRDAGGALLAIEAARWEGDCAGGCGGVERVAALAAAARWHPDVARLARLWQVVALKEALDAADVAKDRPTWPDALVRLVDALLGTGAGPLPVTVVERSRAGPATWLALGRSLGQESVDEHEVRAALGAHLANTVDAALADPQPKAIRDLLERIRHRAG